MIASDPRYCPQCEQMLHSENCTIVHQADRDRVSLLCEHCDVGWEIETYLDGERFVLDFRQRTEPDNYRAFLTRLEEARAA